MSQLCDMRNDLLDGEIVESLAREIFKLRGCVVISTFGSSRVYQVGEEINHLWGVRSLTPWIVDGISSVHDYVRQMNLIRRLRPDWPGEKFAIAKHGCYWDLIPNDAENFRHRGIDDRNHS